MRIQALLEVSQERQLDGAEALQVGGALEATDTVLGTQAAVEVIEYLESLV